MAKVGVVTALINYNLRKDALIHTIEVASCKGIIYGLELEDGKQDVLTIESLVSSELVRPVEAGLLSASAATS